MFKSYEILVDRNITAQQVQDMLCTLQRLGFLSNNLEIMLNDDDDGDYKITIINHSKKKNKLEAIPPA